MVTESAPVVIMRWFRDGAGYAYDACVDSPTLTAVIGALSAVFSRPPGPPFRLTLPDGRILLGDKQSDEACLDEKAAGRQPTIVRVVLLECPVNPRVEAQLRQRLAALTLPTTPGPRAAGLSLALSAPPRVPEPVMSPSAALLRRAPWAAAGLLFLVEAALYADSQLAGSPLASLCRAAAITLAAGLASLLIPRVASRDDLNHLEAAWAGEEGEASVFPPPGLLDDEASVVLPDGRLVSAAKLTAPGGWVRAGSTPTAVSDPEYTAVGCHLGLTVVRGYERLRTGDGVETRCAFVRCYAPVGLHWQLVFVQWTPAADAKASTLTEGATPARTPATAVWPSPASTDQRKER